MDLLAFIVLLGFTLPIFIYLCLMLFGIISPKKLQKLIDKISPKRFCLICRKETQDKMSPGVNQKSNYYCRLHLVEEFKKKLLNSSYNFLMVEYQPEIRSLDLDYSYYPLSEMKGLGWSEKDKEILISILEEIKQKTCHKCQKDARVLFISAREAPYSLWGPQIHKKYLNMGQFLCLEHTVELAIPPIEHSKKRFNNWGVGAPYKEDGFMITTEV